MKKVVILSFLSAICVTLALNASFAIVTVEPSSPSASQASPFEATRFAEVREIIGQRCVMCHGAGLASKNIRLDSDEEIVGRAKGIYVQTVVKRSMPFNNLTNMTEHERDVLAQWFTDWSKR